MGYKRKGLDSGPDELTCGATLSRRRLSQRLVARWSHTLSLINNVEGNVSPLAFEYEARSWSR